MHAETLHVVTFQNLAGFETLHVVKIWRALTMLQGVAGMQRKKTKRRQREDEHYLFTSNPTQV